jgi:hypothetical protein
VTTRQAWCAKCDGVVLCDELGCVACRVQDQERARRVRTNGPIALAAFCAICVDSTEGLHPVRFDGCGPVYTVCKRCDSDGVPTSKESSGRYAPIDETLEIMRVRILRALRHLDWITTDGLMSVVGIDADWQGNERQRYDKEIFRSVRSGLVECDRTFGRDNWRYRITAAGRASHAAALRRNAA